MGQISNAAPAAPIYVCDAEYDRLVADLLAAPNTMCPASAIKQALGEALNVWPARIEDDAEAALEEERTGFAFGVVNGILRVRAHGRARQVPLNGADPATLAREVADTLLTDT